MTTYNIVRNVISDDISLSVSDDFVEKHPVARIRHPISISFGVPKITMKPSMAIDSTVNFSVGIPTGELQGGTFVYNSSTTDAYILVPQGSKTYYATTTAMLLGCPDDYNQGILLNGIQGYWLYAKLWIPFTLTDIGNSDTILSAILTVTSASNDGARTPVRFKFACQQVGGDVAAPTTYDDLNSRTMTSNYTTYKAPTAWVTGQTYQFDITSSVQEIVNRPAWGTTEGKKIAVLCFDNGSGTRCLRQIYSYDNGANYPTLSVTI